MYDICIYAYIYIHKYMYIYIRRFLKGPEGNMWYVFATQGRHSRSPLKVATQGRHSRWPLYVKTVTIYIYIFSHYMLKTVTSYKKNPGFP